MISFSKTRAIILAGGEGSRLWPLSRKLLPKQFLPFHSRFYKTPMTTYQEAVHRGCLVADEIVIVVPKHLEATARYQAQQITPEDKKIQFVIEDEPAGTLGAVMLGVVGCEPFDAVVVLSSDHTIHEKKFTTAIDKALHEASQNAWVLLGVYPDQTTKPNTGFGYIKTSPIFRPDGIDHPFFTVEEYVEKPSAELAETMQHCLWNAGIFIFRPYTFQDRFSTLYDDTKPAVDAVTMNLVKDRCGVVSVVMLGDATDWYDLGTWEGLYNYHKLPDQSTVCLMNSKALHCENSILAGCGIQTIGIGLNNLVVAVTHDAVLVMDRSHESKLKHVFQYVGMSNPSLVRDPISTVTPWGSYEVLTTRPQLKIKLLYIKPSHQTSLQKHHKRSEILTVIAGAVVIEKEQKALNLEQGASIAIKRGELHRIKNTSGIYAVLMEAQRGDNEEDDIERVEDAYGRKGI